MILAFLLLGCPSKHVYPDGGGLEAQLEREVIALQATVRRLEAQEPGGGGPDPIYAELHQVLAACECTVESRGSTTLITLRDGDLFAADEWTVRDEARMSLDMLATAVKMRPGYTVTIEGHTGDLMPASMSAKFSNLYDLSYVRAGQVMSILVDDFHVETERFALVAKGPNQPVASNDTAAGQNQNRRVVILIQPPAKR